MTTTTNTDDPAYIVDGVLTDGEAWVPLITNVLTSDATGVTFQSSTGANDWSQYMDLKIIAYDQSDTEIYGVMRLNNDTGGTSYNIQQLYGNGSTVTANSYAANYIHCGYIAKVSDGANVFSVQIIDLFDINSGKYKSVLSQSANDEDGSGHVELNAGTWKSQAPITEIDYLAWTGDWKDGSRFDLFGVLPRMVTA